MIRYQRVERKQVQRRVQGEGDSICLEKGKSEPSSVRGEDLAIKSGRRTPCVGVLATQGPCGNQAAGTGSGRGA